MEFPDFHFNTVKVQTLANYIQIEIQDIFYSVFRRNNLVLSLSWNTGQAAYPLRDIRGCMGVCPTRACLVDFQEEALGKT